MRLAGRVTAAIEVLDDILNRHRPASMALADWGRSHRFAGSGDRSAIGTLIYDALRKRASFAWRMGEQTPRALALATLRHGWALEAEAIEALCDGSAHAPEPLSAAEKSALTQTEPGGMPGWVAADIPEWLFPSFEAAFAGDAVAVGQSLAERAPIDLRVNLLKTDRGRVLKALGKYGAEPTDLSPVGVRIPAAGPQQKNPNVEAETAHGRGWFEVQDEASQLALYLSGAGPRLQLLDLCAGSGGKTLGMAGLMMNTGQIHAYDTDKQRLRPIFERLKRAGARNVQVLSAGDESALQALEARMDVVFVDAPCSGSGVWRRRPDAKWRITPLALDERLAEQRSVLAMGAKLVKPGGRLVYATCSVLPEENRKQSARFGQDFPDFTEIGYRQIWQATLPSPLVNSAAENGLALQLTPFHHKTDGFYVNIFERRA